MSVATVAPVADSPAQHLADRLRRARAAKNMRAYEVAWLARCSPAFVAKVEAGRAVRPDAELLSRIARVLGLDPYALIAPEA